MRTAPPTRATRASAIQARPRNRSCSYPRLRRHERTAAARSNCPRATVIVAPSRRDDESADSASGQSNQNDEHAVARSLPLRFPRHRRVHGNRNARPTATAARAQSKTKLANERLARLTQTRD